MRIKINAFRAGIGLLTAGLVISLGGCGSSGKYKVKVEEVETLQKELTETREAWNKLSTDLNKLRREREALEKEYQLLKLEYAQMQSSTTPPDSLLKDLNQQLDTLRETKNKVIKTLDERLALKDHAIEQLAIYKADVQTKLAALQEQLKQLEEENLRLKTQLGQIQ